MMTIYRLVLCCFWLILSWILSRGNAEKRSYMTYDMTTICKKLPNFKIRMHHSSAGSTGILKASDYLSEDEESECVAKITPPKGYGVVYHIEEILLRKDANNDCRDYLKIYNETSRSNVSSPICRDCCRFSRAEQVCAGHCGYESDGLVCEEFCDKNNETVLSTDSARSLQVHFHTRCGTCTDRREQVGFRMVFTAFKMQAAQGSSCGLPSEFQCDNGRCIWSGLTCDGYNNCGDLSDEDATGNSKCANFSDPVKAVIVASAVIVTILLGVVIAYLPKSKSLQTFLGTKRKSPKKPDLSLKKPRSVTFHSPLPKIREMEGSSASLSDSQQSKVIDESSV